MTVRIGFIGLGLIGRPLVENMLRAGLQPIVFDIDPAPIEAVVEQGAVAADTVAELAAQCDVVGVCVPADSHVRSVLDGREGLLANLPRGSVVAVHSTILPETIAWAAEQAAGHGVRVVEACLTGGHYAAARGETTFLLGGAPEDLAVLQPVLSACGETLVDAGPLGNAGLLKLCLNLQTYGTHLAIAEAIRLAKALELPVDGLKQAMRANGQLGEMSENFFGLHELPDEIIADAKVSKLRRTTGAIIEKDLALMQMVASQHGVDVPARDLASAEYHRTYLLPDEGET
jgi:3-hydroxyisobutyrate dehydrogenase